MPLPLVLEQSVSSILTKFFSLEFLPFSLKGGMKKALPKIPDDFTPVLRFCICSDVHLSGKSDDKNIERLKTVFADTYKYSQGCSYKKTDAVLVAGDMTGGGEDSQYEMFNSVVGSQIKSETKLLVCLGNHEFIHYRDYDPTIGYTKYKKYISEDVDTHSIINGYHIIGVSYSDDAKTFNGKAEWLTKQLDAAVADTGTKPIFVFQHPQPFNTVYGSINWGDKTIKNVLKKYPQVIDFSGHSHYANSDPRSIWQGSFTAVGTGSTAALMGNLNYIDGDKDAPGLSGAFWIAEVDSKGNVALKLYDCVNHEFFGKNLYYLANVADKKSHLYTWGNLKSLDTPPVFPKGSSISSSENSDGSINISFPDAQAFWGAENYKITLKKNGKRVWANTVISDYVRTVSEKMNVNVGKLENGEYKITVKAYSPYAKKGDTLVGNITIQR